MHSLDPDAWATVRGMILNELSSRFSLGYLAAELLGSGSVQKSKFLFGFANEIGNKRTSLKLRVILAKEQLLKTAWQMNHRHEELQEPEYRTGYHRNRWIYTVKNMADLYHDMKRWDPNNKPLREIELCMAASGAPDVPSAALRQAHAGEGGEVATSPPAPRALPLRLAPPTRTASEPGESILVRGQSTAPRE